MPKKGSVNNPHGRPKGSENKSTTELKQTVANFVASNATKFAGWLDKIEADNGPLEAFKRVEALLEYALPKQARVEQQQLDEHGLPTKPTYILNMTVPGSKLDE